MTGSVLFRESDPDAGFLANLHDDEVATILSYTQSRRYRPGETAVRAGERERSVYIVTAGRFEVLVPTPAGPRQVAVLRAGDMFGELAFFDNQPRSADVQALEESEARFRALADSDAPALMFVFEPEVTVRLAFAEFGTMRAYPVTSEVAKAFVPVDEFTPRFRPAWIVEPVPTVAVAGLFRVAPAWAWATVTASA